jgi:hypothetical protein
MPLTWFRLTRCRVTDDVESPTMSSRRRMAVELLRQSWEAWEACVGHHTIEHILGAAGLMSFLTWTKMTAQMINASVPKRLNPHWPSKKFGKNGSPDCSGTCCLGVGILCEHVRSQCNGILYDHEPLTGFQAVTIHLRADKLQANLPQHVETLCRLYIHMNRAEPTKHSRLPESGSFDMMLAMH